MLKPRFIAAMIPLFLFVLAPGAASGQNYPNKPIRIVSAGIGGGAEFAARLVAQGLSAPLGQEVIVDSRAAILAIDTVAKASPDGYTILVAASPLWIGPLLRKTDYDPVQDFSPISLTNWAPNVLVVHPSVPVRSVRELIDLAKAKPGALNYSTGATGAASHLAAELFKAMTGVHMVRIPYKSNATETADLLAGQVQLSFGGPSSVTPHIKAGKLRPLAVTSAEPSTLFPGLPTIAASGVPGYEAIAIYCFFAPAKTAQPIINKLNQEMVRILNTTDVKEKFFNVGMETVGGSPERLAAAMKADMARMGKVIRDAGIRDE